MRWSIPAMLTLGLLAAGCGAVDDSHEATDGAFLVSSTGHEIRATVRGVPDWVEICIYGFDAAGMPAWVSCGTRGTGEARGPTGKAHAVGLAARTAGGLLVSDLLEVTAAKTEQVAIGVEPMRLLAESSARHWLRSVESFSRLRHAALHTASGLARAVSHVIPDDEADPDPDPDGEADPDPGADS